jgi:hypothetical protein
MPQVITRAADSASDSQELMLPARARSSRPVINANTSPDEARNCRYGVSAHQGTQYWLQALKAGWFVNFTAYPAPGIPSGTEFVPIIRTHQDRGADGSYLPTYTVTPALTDTALGAAIDARPGSLWLVGNEPDREWDQDDTYPDVYARAYHQIYYFIKGRDPSAQVGIAGLVQASPGRLQYLDIVWHTYLQEFGRPLPVDVWNMHLYNVPEKRTDGIPTVGHVALGTDPALAILESYDPDGGGPLTLKDTCPLGNVYCYAEHDNISHFVNQIIAMRTWMKNHGLQHKPLIISEYSILYVFWDYDDPVNPSVCYLQDEFGGCFTQQRVSNYMINTFNYLESATDPNLGYPADNNRLVQQWLWFSLYAPTTGHSSNLLTDDYTTLTQVGQTFQNQVGARPLTNNLMIEQVAYSVGFTTTPTSTASVTLSAMIRNNGSTEVASSFQVTFYSNSALTQPIGSVSVPGLPGCARQEYVVETQWAGLSPGARSYWVKVDSANVIVESNESSNDNVAKGWVIINPDQLFLPGIKR